MSAHGGGAKRKHKGGGHDEEHENHERWLVTYADMITLLMVLFIVMFAMSSVDQKKFNELKSGLAAGFGSNTSVLSGSSSLLTQAGASTVKPVVPPRAGDPVKAEEAKAINDAVKAAMRLANSRKYAEAQAEAARLSGVEKAVKAALAKHGMLDDVRTTLDGRGLTISLVSRHVVFESNMATLTARGRAVVDALAPVLRDVPDDISVEGHTNQAAGRPKYYASDWDLASARAVTVLRYLTETKGVPETRVSASSYGHTKPLVPPSQVGSQELNKRVDIVVLAELGNEDAQMLDQAARERRRVEADARTHTQDAAHTGGSGTTNDSDRHDTGPTSHAGASAGTHPEEH